MRIINTFQLIKNPIGNCLTGCAGSASVSGEYWEFCATRCDSRSGTRIEQQQSSVLFSVNAERYREIEGWRGRNKVSEGGWTKKERRGWISPGAL